MVSTGQHFIAALAHPYVVNVMLVNDITLEEGDFFVGNSSVLVDRNVTIEGRNTAGGSVDTILDFAHIKRKLRLGAGVTLILRHIVLVRFRDGSISSSPGFDLLLPTTLSSGSSPALVYIEDCLVVLRWCYPPSLQAQNIRLFSRPSSLPGKQNVTLRTPQTSCSNDTAAPLWQRCWPSAGWYLDFGLAGADLDLRYVPFPNNYSLWLVNTKYVCSAILEEDCVLALGPVGCLYKKLAEEMKAAPPAGLSVRSSRAVLAPSLGGSLGGFAVVALVVGLVALGLHRRRRRAAAGSAPCSDGTLSPGSPPLVTGLPDGALPRKEPLGPGGTDPNDDDTTSRVAVWSLKCEPAAVCSLDLHVVVTPLTPPRPDLAMGVECGNQVTLLPVLRGKGSFGRVQEGMYGGQRVAVKLLPIDIVSDQGEQQQQGEQGPTDRPGDGAREAAGAGTAVAAAVEVTASETLAAGDCAAGLRGCETGPGSPGKQRLSAMEEKAAGAQAQQGESEGARDQEQGGKVGRCGARALQTFAQEVEVLGRCCHPNVVRLLAACLGPPQPCLVMELMETSLDKLLHGNGKESPLLPVPMVLRIAIDVVRGLEYLHPTIVHRDLKPANVLVNISGPAPVAKISDFGLSRMRNTVMPTKHPEAGTPAYMAPECFDTENLKITHQADIYSFAVCVWEMLTGLLPWWGCTPLAVAYSVTLLGERLPLSYIPPQRCPPALSQLLAQCFEAEPRRRPAAAELVKELEFIAKGIAADECSPAGAAEAAVAECSSSVAAPASDWATVAAAAESEMTFSNPDGASHMPKTSPLSIGRLLTGSSLPALSHTSGGGEDQV